MTTSTWFKVCGRWEGPEAGENHYPRAGQVGGTLAEHLADEQNDITVVDEQTSTLKRLAERLDVRTVLGNGAHPGTS